MSLSRKEFNCSEIQKGKLTNKKAHHAMSFFDSTIQY